MYMYNPYTPLCWIKLYVVTKMGMVTRLLFYFTCLIQQLSYSACPRHRESTGKHTKSDCYCWLKDKRKPSITDVSILNIAISLNFDNRTLSSTETLIFVPAYTIFNCRMYLNNNNGKDLISDQGTYLSALTCLPKIKHTQISILHRNTAWYKDNNDNMAETLLRYKVSTKQCSLLRTSLLK